MRVAPRVSHQSIDGEVVIISLQTGTYYSLRGLAASLWDRLVAGTTTDALREQLVAFYPDQSEAAAACDAFVLEMLSEGLLIEGEAAAGTSPSTAFPTQFSAPVVEKFTDMQELLVLDPIHEVDATGWPNRPLEP